MIDVSFLLFVFHVAMATSIREIMDLFEGFSQFAAPVVVTALWQGAILAAGLAVCMRLARRASAVHRFWIWATGFAALVSLPFVPSWMANVAGAAASRSIVLGSTVARGANSGGPWLRLDLRWSLVIGALWIAASVFRAAALGVQTLRLRKLWKSATPIEDQSLAEVKFDGGMRRRAKVCTTRVLDRPAVIGFFAPRILIPKWLFARLTRDELEHVILHESEHLRRGDDWINLAQKLCLVLFPLNPALAWMDSRLCREREMACDEGVVKATKAPRAYAACLASLAERGLKHRSELLSLGAWQRRPELVERVNRILRRRPESSSMTTAALMGALSCGLVFGSIEFARCPQLVAFVPEPQLAAQHSPAVVQGDARFVNASYGMDRRKAAASEFRAIDAVAKMPAPVDRASQPVGRAAKKASQSSSHKSGLRPNLISDTSQNLEGAPREVLLKAEIPNASPAQRNGQIQPEWIILTAWEQVEVSGLDHRGANPDAGLRQDYDFASPPEQTTSAGKNQPHTGTRSPATITRLIFRIYPASAFANLPDSPSSVDQPPAIQLRDGWFAFQL